MNDAGSKRDEILDAAEAMIRRVGYNAFSMRDIAQAVGIKSASVHYYFPAKSDLGIAVTERYTRRFISGLGAPEDQAGADPVHAYVAAFRAAFGQDRTLCLCAVLGAESAGLPTEVTSATRTFFTANLDWLDRALAAARPRTTAAERLEDATQIVAALEGAMIISSALADNGPFEHVARSLAR